MYWPKFSEAGLIKKIRKGRSRNGVTCTYIKWTKHVGLKVFTSKWARDQCAKLQGIAAENKLGPKVGEKAQFEVLWGETDDWDSFENAPQMRMKKLYCYFTEHADRPRKYQRTGKKRRDLECKLHRVGIDHNDLHTENVGLVNGKLVCIDFDYVSCIKCKPGEKVNPDADSYS